MILLSVSEKLKLRKDFQYEDTNKKNYLKEKRKVKRTFYQAKPGEDRNKFGDVIRKEDQKKCDALKNYKKDNQNNQEIIGEQYVENDDCVLFIDEDKKITGNSYQEKLSNTEFSWDRNSLSQTDTVSSVSHLKEPYMTGESISKMKSSKAAGPPG